MDADFKNDLSGTLSNLNNTSESLEEIIGSKEEELKSTIESIENFTKMLSNNSENMSKTFGSLQAISDSLAAADIKGTISNLKTSLDETTQLMNNLNNGEGTAGQFLKNDALYTNLTNSLESLNVLLQDMKANPKRYVHFSIFGKKSTPSD